MYDSWDSACFSSVWPPGNFCKMNKPGCGTSMHVVNLGSGGGGFGPPGASPLLAPAAPVLSLEPEGIMPLPPVKPLILDDAAMVSASNNRPNQTQERAPSLSSLSMQMDGWMRQSPLNPKMVQALQYKTIALSTAHLSIHLPSFSSILRLIDCISNLPSHCLHQARVKGINLCSWFTCTNLPVAIQIGPPHFSNDPLSPNPSRLQAIITHFLLSWCQAENGNCSLAAKLGVWGRLAFASKMGERGHRGG